MTLVRVGQVGQFGVNKDLSLHELPPAIWTDANNIRFADGCAQQVSGYKDLYASPSFAPYYLLPLTVGSTTHWIYAGAVKLSSVVDGPTHTDRRKAATDYSTTGRNAWTGCTLSGWAILHNNIDTPQSWNGVAGTFIDLVNWTATTTCKAIRTYKNSLVALNVTVGGTNYPQRVKWSHPADPGTLPTSWDVTDATKDAGWTDLADGSAIVDGLALRSSFMIYTKDSVWRMDFTGGAFVYSFNKVLGASGAMSRNCIVEIDGQHFVLTGSDCIIHDGQTSTSVLDKQTRKYLFAQIEPAYSDLCFVVVDRLFSEVHVCYPRLGSTICDRSMVWNWIDKTVSFRDTPSINHAASGPVDDSGTSGTFTGSSGTIDAQTGAFDANSSSLKRSVVVYAANASKLYLLDSGTSFAGTAVNSYIERAGMSLGSPEKMKLVKGIRPRIYGDTGLTVQVYVGSSDDPYGAITYGSAIPFTIGTSVRCDTFCTGRYLAVKFATGSALSWRLDSYDIEVEESGGW